MTFGSLAQGTGQVALLRAFAAGILGAVLAAIVAAATVLAAGPDGLLGRVDAAAWLPRLAASRRSGR